MISQLRTRLEQLPRAIGFSTSGAENASPPCSAEKHAKTNQSMFDRDACCRLPSVLISRTGFIFRHASGFSAVSLSLPPFFYFYLSLLFSSESSLPPSLSLSFSLSLSLSLSFSSLSLSLSLSLCLSVSLSLFLSASLLPFSSLSYYHYISQLVYFLTMNMNSGGGIGVTLPGTDKSGQWSTTPRSPTVGDWGSVGEPTLALHSSTRGLITSSSNKLSSVNRAASTASRRSESSRSASSLACNSSNCAALSVCSAAARRVFSSRTAWRNLARLEREELPPSRNGSRPKARAFSCSSPTQLP